MKSTRMLLPALLLAMPMAGCECVAGLFPAIPFQTESEGTIVFPLGAVGDCTSDDDGTVPENGEPDENGNLTTYTHVNDGTTCTLKADWQGRLVDMSDVKAEVDAELEEAGVDPTTVTLRIVSMTPTVQTVILRDDETDEPIDLSADALLGYFGEISVDGDPEIITAGYTAPGDPTVPDVETKDSAALVEQANAAFADGTPLEATGSGNCTISMAQIAEIQVAGQPALVVSFAIGLEGEASVGGGG